MPAALFAGAGIPGGGRRFLPYSFFLFSSPFSRADSDRMAFVSPVKRRAVGDDVTESAVFPGYTGTRK